MFSDSSSIPEVAISLFENCPMLHMSIDGVQAAGRHNDIYLALDLRSDEATIPSRKVDFKNLVSRLYPHTFVGSACTDLQVLGFCGHTNL